MKLFNSTTVKRLAVLGLAVSSIGFSAAKANADEVPQSDVAVAYQPRQMQDLEQLTAPIALYPDALLAQVMVASTYPNDVIDAAQYLQNGGDPTQIDGFSWDASVKGLVQTPDVLNQLAGDVDWMNQLGDAFLNQQQDVFAAVQALRVEAQNAGNLASNDQQQVLTTDNGVQIIPANPQMIYVPQYDPQVVYVVREHRDIDDPCITFSTGIRVGVWLHDDFDWYDHRVYVGNWGFERPWWHHDDRGNDRIDYAQDRPGVYVNNVTNVRNVTNIRNTTNVKNVNITNTTTAWTRDGAKPAPRHEPGPIVQHVAKPMPAVPTRTVTQPMPPAIQPNRNVNVATHTVTPPVQPNRNVSVANHTVTQPAMPAIQPNRNVNVPTHTVTQPVKPAVQPTRNVTVPTHTVTQPVKPAVQPTRNVNVPTHTVTQPVKPAVLPTRNVNVPTHTVTQPVKPAVQPTRPVSLPTRSVQPVKPIAQPTRPVSLPTHTVQQPKPVVQPSRPVQTSRPVAQPSRPANVPTAHVQTAQPVSHGQSTSQPSKGRNVQHPTTR